MNASSEMTSPKPIYMFVYGTLKQSEANFKRWMAPFMAAESDNNKSPYSPHAAPDINLHTTEVHVNTNGALKENDEKKGESSCACSLRFVGPALTVHRYPFVIYDYPCVINAPMDTVYALQQQLSSSLSGTEVKTRREEQTNGEEIADLIADTAPEAVFFTTPQRVLGEVYEVVPCSFHLKKIRSEKNKTDDEDDDDSFVKKEMEGSRVVKHLDLLESTENGMYTRTEMPAEVLVASADADEGRAPTKAHGHVSSSDEIKKRITVTANIYFRTGFYPRNELVEMLTGAMTTDSSSNTSKPTIDTDVAAAAAAVKASIEAVVPLLADKNDGTSGEDCIAEGRVAAPTLRGFLRTFRGKDHRPIAPD